MTIKDVISILTLGFMAAAATCVAYGEVPIAIGLAGFAWSVRRVI